MAVDAEGDRAAPGPHPRSPSFPALRAITFRVSFDDDPFASVIDTELPKAHSSVHLLLRDKASWVEPQIDPNDDRFEGYPELSIEDWHKKHRLWIE